KHLTVRTVGRSLKPGLARLSRWPALPWCGVGGGGALVWLYIGYLFWLDVATTVGHLPDRGGVQVLLLLIGSLFVVIGVGAGCVAFAGFGGIGQQPDGPGLVFGALEIALGTLVWLAAAIAVFWWIGLIAIH